MSDHIRIRNWPTDHAASAYAAGHYIEALQSLHGWIEVKLREILLLQRVNLPKPDIGWKRAWDISNELSLNNTARSLFVIGAISEDLLNKLLAFNRVRNNLIHKMFHDPCDKEYLGIPKVEYDIAYQEGSELGELLQKMAVEIVG